MVLYSLTTLPYLSICDEETFGDLFTGLITEIDSYDDQEFNDNLLWFQDRYACLGITCDMVGTSVHDDGSWAECVDRDASNTMIAGYKPTSDEAVEVSFFFLSFLCVQSRVTCSSCSHDFSRVLNYVDHFYTFVACV